MGWLTEPLTWPFIRKGLLAAVLVGVACAAVGCHVVLRRMSLVGDALAHTALPGLVVAALWGWSLFAGALVAGVVTALIIGWLTRREALREDAGIGVAFTGMFALGILLLAETRSQRDLTHILFGNVLGVGAADLWLVGGLTLLVIVALAAFHKELAVSAFDPGHARVAGLRVDAVRQGLLILIALVVVGAIKVVGVVLTSALLVTPAAAASLVTTSVARMMVLAAAIAAVAGVAGLYASYHLGVSSGAAVVLACTAIFGATWAGRAGREGALRRRRDRPV
ncbi:MAG: metal ABC transporter permease [Thermoleophilia bacterium]|jgi:manganese/iron transport system permease protein|nr:metal ABC transporter permease [Thermoleophilia bacterium]